MTYDGNINNWNKWLSLKEEGYTSIRGNIYCGHNQLTSLVGGPEFVSGFFNCNCNQLTSLKGGPKSVGGYFDCCDNNIDDDLLLLHVLKYGDNFYFD